MRNNERIVRILFLQQRHSGEFQNDIDAKILGGVMWEARFFLGGLFHFSTLWKIISVSFYRALYEFSTTVDTSIRWPFGDKKFNSHF
jgi:hypothetical protein